MTLAGASPEEWAHFDLILGLTDDLLPIVCEPGLPISPNSALKSYGKTPSIVLGNGVCGLTGWTRRHTTQEQITTWSQDNRLGICLQTRRIRAIDVDIPDRDAARAVFECLSGWFANRSDDEALPIRTRADSGKFLLLVELAGDYPKQVLKTAAGPIEFLARGNQCVIAGRHKDGARYEWLSGLPRSIPLVTEGELREIQAELRTRFGTNDWTAGRMTKERDASIVSSKDDPVVAYLTRVHPEQILRRAADRLDVICPWSSEHTSHTDDSATSVFPAGTGGFECGHFRCLHAHCASRTTADYLDHIGYLTDGFVDERGGITTQDVLQGFGIHLNTMRADRPIVTGSGPIALLPPSPLDRPRYDIDANKGKIKAKMNNVLLWLEYLTQQGQGVGFDLFRDEVVLYTAHGQRAFTDADYTRFQARADRESFMPLSYEMVRHGIHTVAQDHCFDSGVNWIHALPEWDGEERVAGFCHRYLGAPDDAHSTAVGRYLWTAMPGRILHPGIQADMTLVMVSKQGTRKSSMIRVLAPIPDWFTDISFSDKEADLARLTKGKTLVELPELKGLRTRENDWIKAFVTKRENSWVPKYFEMQTTYKRRFLMIGTTNDREFLADPTGERRWLPLDVGQLDDAAMERDHDQLWAEGATLFLTHGILWQDAQKTAAEVHIEHTVHDMLEDQIAEWLDMEDSLTHQKPSDRKFLRVFDVWKDALGGGLRVAPKHEQMRIADALTRLGYVRKTQRITGRAQKVWVKTTEA